MLQACAEAGLFPAARIVDQMEEIGVVGPFEGSKPRQILVTREQVARDADAGGAPMDTYQETWRWTIRPPGE
jgi:S-DNA-T family DNA segregation ATPase FtsK/SpoIIIE